MADGGQDAYLIDCVVDFPVGEVDEFDFFEGIYGLVDEPLDFVDAGVGALPQLADDLEVVDRHG